MPARRVVPSQFRYIIDLDERGVFRASLYQVLDTDKEILILDYDSETEEGAAELERLVVDERVDIRDAASLGRYLVREGVCPPASRFLPATGNAATEEAGDAADCELHRPGEADVFLFLNTLAHLYESAAEPAEGEIRADRLVRDIGTATPEWAGQLADACERFLEQGRALPPEACPGQGSAWARRLRECAATRLEQEAVEEEGIRPGPA